MRSHLGFGNERDRHIITPHFIFYMLVRERAGELKKQNDAKE